eukprot:GHRR01015652.1.p1 GENE.GHRR01015652.1~~GHRR01015652.1.p1  ORF type:complete len:128 (-),score=34.28 GHRR01015652.1:313-696(-)
MSECLYPHAGPAVGHSSTVWSVAFSQDGKHLASVSDDCTLKVWDLQWDSEATSIDPHATLAASISGNHQRTIFTVDWSTDGVIATGMQGLADKDCFNWRTRLVYYMFGCQLGSPAGGVLSVYAPFSV